MEIVNLDQPDASATVLAGENGSEWSRRQQGPDARLLPVDWSEAGGGKLSGLVGVIQPIVVRDQQRAAFQKEGGG